MKRILMMVAALALTFTASAEDSWMYWMVDATAANESLAKLDGFTGFDTVKIGVHNGDTMTADSYLTLAWNNGGQIESLGTAYSPGSGSLTEFSDTLLALANIAGDFEGKTFYVELYNSGAFVARSEEGLDYSGALAEAALDPQDAWVISSFTSAPVPEPNSAMLMLLGVAALGLRRKRAKA